MLLGNTIAASFMFSMIFLRFHKRFMLPKTWIRYNCKVDSKVHKIATPETATTIFTDFVKTDQFIAQNFLKINLN
jgi:hypothetical protein